MERGQVEHVRIGTREQLVVLIEFLIENIDVGLIEVDALNLLRSVVGKEGDVSRGLCVVYGHSKHIVAPGWGCTHVREMVNVGYLCVIVYRHSDLNCCIIVLTLCL